MNRSFTVATIMIVAIFVFGSSALHAQEPTMVAPNLDTRVVTSGLVTPTAMAFIDEDEFFILEKNTGRVKRVLNGVVQGTVLDLAVNNGSERGLLGIALHPNFPKDNGVYLFWSCRAEPPPSTNPFFPTVTNCTETPMLGADTDDILAVPLLGNRVDRFNWDGTSLTYDRNIVQLLSFQNDGAPMPPGQGDEDQPARGNHDGGVLAFGPDGKLYIMFGDAGDEASFKIYRRARLLPALERLCPTTSSAARSPITRILRALSFASMPMVRHRPTIPSTILGELWAARSEITFVRYLTASIQACRFRIGVYRSLLARGQFHLCQSLRCKIQSVLTGVDRDRRAPDGEPTA